MIKLSGLLPTVLRTSNAYKKPYLKSTSANKKDYYEPKPQSKYPIL